MKPKSPRWRVAAVQMEFRPTVAANLDSILEQLGQAVEVGADVVLFPECAVTGYGKALEQLAADEVEGALAEIACAARRAGCSVLVGAPTFERGRWYNSLVVYDRRGRERFRYRKVHLTSGDRRVFAPGNSVAFFRLDGIPCTAIICHERRFPELVRLPVMLGARVLFHPNAGLDRLAVSRGKRAGRDGIAVRAFENDIFYVFANSVGPQGGGRWSAGDSKIVGPDSRVLALADNARAAVISAAIDPGLAGRKYAREALVRPAFLRPHWRAILAACRRRLRESGP